jgi:DNA-binding winged helix-turn-helix (wHTH) protein/tetratricopeptide (TPR) repeat protein/TolB-like protein
MAMQAAQSSSRTRGFGIFEVDLRAAELRKHGVRIKLQEQPFQILSLLLDHPGEVVTRDELRQKLWPAHTFVDFDRSLNKAMTKLRAALGDSADSPRYVETIPRHGYRFLAQVRSHHEELESPIAAEKYLSDERMESPAKPVAPESARHSFRFFDFHTRAGSNRLYVAVAALVAAVLSALVYARNYQPGPLSGSSGVVSPRRSVAVLDFTNLSGDPHQAWLSTAFSDWLTTELTAGEHVRAIPAESVARMKMELSLPEVDSLGSESLVRIRKNLGTDFVISGSYATLGAKSEGQIRLDLRLQDTRNGETVGAISEIGTEAHLLDLVSRAGEHLREKLGVRAVTQEEAAEVAIALPSKSETARLYSEGLARLRAFDALQARDLLRKAIAVEPNYAISHAALATAWGQLGYDENARTEAKKAFDLSANLSRAERLLVEARYHETSRDWEKATGNYRANFELLPDNLDYDMALANAEYKANKWKDTLTTVAALRRLPAPLRDDPRIDLAEDDAARSLGDTKRSEAALTRAAEKAQAAGASLLLAKARLDQAWLYENLGRFAEAEGPIREAKRLYTSANDRAGVAEATTIGAIALKNQGEYLGAKKGYEEVLALYRQIGYRTGQAAENDNIGDILVYLGDLEGAHRGYESALAIYQDLGDQNGEALAKNGLGDVFLIQGDHQKAKEIYESSLEICRRTGNRGREAGALAGMGRAHLLEGDLAQALKEETQARTIFEEIGDKTEVANMDLSLAELYLNEGKDGPAATSAKQAAEVFEANKAASEEAAASLLLARSWIVNGRIADARKSVDQVRKVASETHNRQLELSASLTAARIRAASKDPRDVREALTSLNGVVTEATSGKFRSLALEARLALGEVEMNSSNETAGRSHLEALEKDAAREGFQLIVRKAASALRNTREVEGHQAGKLR